MAAYNLTQLHKVETDIVSSQTRLSICLKANGFSFSLIRDDSLKLLAVGHFDCDLSGSIPNVMNTLRESFASIGIRMFKFAKIRVVCLTNKSAWIPYKLYDSAKNRDYLKTSAHVCENETVLGSIDEKLDAVNVFAYPVHTYSGAKILFGNAEYVSQYSVLANYAFDIASFSQNTLIVNKRSGFMDLVLFKGNSFTMTNTIVYTEPTDMIYNLLFVLQQSEVDTEAVKLLLTGDTYAAEELQLLRRYVKDVSYANPMENIRVGMEFDEIDLQNYFLVIA